MLPFIDLGFWRVPVYGLLLATAIVLGIWMAVRRAPRHGLDKDFVYSTSAMAVLVALFGAKLTNVILAPEAFSWRTFIFGAGTFLGGFLAAFAVTLFLSWRAKQSFWRLGDAMAASLALGVMLVRVGCFAASCDYGQPANVPWAVVFTNEEAARFTGVPLGIPLHPSQLYESALGLVILLVLLVLERRPHPPGFLLLSFATLYSVGRFALEFLRGDADRGFLGPLSTSQWLSLATLALFFGFYYYSKDRREAVQASRRS